MNSKEFCDKKLVHINGFSMIFWCIVFILLLLSGIYYGNFFIVLPMSLVSLICTFIIPSGFFVNNPNEAKVVEFFGNYIGTIFKSGFFWTIPFVRMRSISLKVRNVNTSKIKVNDFNGNPIEIAAVVVWRVVSPAKACLNVSDYQEFINIQNEAAVRELAGSYPYDAEDNSESLRNNSTKISSKLRDMLQNRLDLVGVIVEDARISHLAYSSEIAQIMLRRQQAKAITNARGYIVRNAIIMVDEILKHFELQYQINLSDEQKVKLVNNLLVSLISEQGTQPTINIE
ncbi:SPFH domain / Band 7 family protein [Ehrlichia chaffeensis str. Heartland]|uniref:SPFH domain /band 7 family protein n=1 Tax=Ehrlichia chaffeensis (strain ATCC CRL-10679 / Arkansas) TaxID=205920 RepID=Q2GH73_EHRCR|nr:SPFH domain-containing protein [Ehrlichia chaffeensis]ABD45004.1 SPFH domain /band 7 family protein [Ehrlichia chaffeensis str. Arkansas]AHX03496.1 SPFH domain / Band 7 family protein [Ehrlichia chaffeensis str. Heartland]AHX05783.1 SPFH domain / Band 7 family protein [Ehrlichia chaffeensis str. Jax]AHX06775.1 SPFH domain / Band 7 family protein [Ehrlichia chaffeensis str. Liberty]AHX07696.1 SPFH domain / Band 7 family protein [Ehrlichia chaffeensis str. Osceola]